MLRNLPYLSLSFLIAAAACSEEHNGHDPAPPIDPGPACGRNLDASVRTLQLFRFEDAAEQIIVHVEREYIEPGQGHSAIYELKSFSIFYEGNCHALASGESGLAYESSHHNWADRATAEIHGVKYTVSIDFDYMDGSGWHVSVHANEVAGDEPVIAKTELFVRGAPVGCWECPGFVPVWITEVMPENGGAHLDEAGDADPWLELWNPSAEAVDLGNWALVLGGAASGSWTFPAGTMIGRHAVLVLWLDGEANEGALHAPFKLPQSGGTLLLKNKDGVSAGARTFTSPGNNRSLDLLGVEGRYVDSDPTPGVASSNQN